MAVRFAIFTALAFCAGAALAQPVYRCTDATGKVTLSDRLCDNTAVDASRVRVRENTLDGREGREQDARAESARLKQQLGLQAAAGACRPDPTPVSDTAPQCTFASYINRDEKGKVLAADAKRECLQNMRLDRACRGSEKTTAAYALWKDHHGLQAQKRQSGKQSFTCMGIGPNMATCN